MTIRRPSRPPATRLASPDPEPTFSARTELARYIPDVNLGRNGRISSAAFLTESGDYLSVNAVEIEPTPTIAKYYQDHFQDGGARVAVACLKITEYNKASAAGNVNVTLDRATSVWVFHDREAGERVPAYRYRKNPLSKSHCGVETTIKMDRLAVSKFARRLAGLPPGRNPHWFF